MIEYAFDVFFYREIIFAMRCIQRWIIYNATDLSESSMTIELHLFSI